MLAIYKVASSHPEILTAHYLAKGSVTAFAGDCHCFTARILKVNDGIAIITTVCFKPSL